MSNAFRERRKAQGLCITGGCDNPPMEGRSQCIGCSKALTKRTTEYRKASTGKAPPFVGGKSQSARARGKAPPPEQAINRAQRAALGSFMQLPARMIPPKVVPVPTPPVRTRGSKAMARPAPTKADVPVRAAGNSVLW